jgi:hypothetical protein
LPILLKVNVVRGREQTGNCRQKDYLMHNKLKDKKINGAALEMIMQDVLKGMVEFTHDTCAGSDAANMEIVAVEEADNSSREASNILPFPHPGKSG